MQAGIDDQATRAKLLRLQVAELAERIVGIGAKLVDDLLGVQRPAFGEGVETGQRSDQRRARFGFGEVSELEAVPRHPFMRRQRRQLVFGPQPGRLEVDVIDRRARPIERRRVHIAERGPVLNVGGDLLDHDVGLQPKVRHLR